MTTEDHPFKPGTRVAIQSRGRWDGLCIYTEAFVEKVHKTGHFTLEGSPQRYRARQDWHDRKRWEAHSTAQLDFSTILLWDEQTDKEVREARTARMVENKLMEIQDRVKALRRGDVTMTKLAAIEALLPPLPKDDK